MHAFSIGDALRFGWRKTREHSGLLFQIVLTFFALQVISTMAQKVLEHSMLGIATAIVLAVVNIILGTGFTVILLKLAQGHQAHFQDLIPEGALIWRFFCASLLGGLLVVVGLVLLIVPGVYLILRFSMVRFAVVEGAGITESLRQSGRLTHGHKWHLLGFFLALAGINLVGLLLLYVGLLVTVPVSGLAWAHVYLKLKSRA